jgi:hypothetical protein
MPPIYFFEKIDLRRNGDYIVTYYPPDKWRDFAILQLTFLQARAPEEIIRKLESELLYWLQRYPIRAMASAFDDTGSFIYLGDASIEHHLVGWVEPGSGKPSLSWRLSDLTRFSKMHALPADLREVYHDIPYLTEEQRQADIDRNVAKRRRSIRFLRGISIVWFVLVPIGVALFEYFGPEWLATAVLLYSLWQGVQEWLRITGRKKQSQREKEKSDKDLKMGHYYYHCERNPEGFLRLKVENFEREAREKLIVEAKGMRPQSLL